ncbi:MAG: NUDIX domain-containing protein [Patescibacteria group bacterium]
MTEHSFKLHVVVFLIFRRDNKVLFLKRQNTRHRDGQFGLPAGHKEVHESVRNAAVREAWEELGITISEDSLNFVGVFDRFSIDRETLDFYFEISNWKGKIRNNEPGKCSELKWFNISDLPNNVIDYVSDSLKFVEKSSDFCETYFEIGRNQPYA